MSRTEKRQIEWKMGDTFSSKMSDDFSKLRPIKFPFENHTNSIIFINTNLLLDNQSVINLQIEIYRSVFRFRPLKSIR